MPPTARSKSESGRDEVPTHQSENPVFTVPVEWMKHNPKKTVKMIKSYGMPAAGVALVGPVASLLPLGPLTPFAALLATSFASFKLRQNVLGGLCALLHAGGLGGFQGQVLSLLSFMSLSATFDTLDTTLQTCINELILNIGGIQATLASLSFSMVTELTGLFGVFPRVIRSNSTHALIAALQSFVVSKGLDWGRNKLHQVWLRLTGFYQNSIHLMLPDADTCESGQIIINRNMLRASLQNLGNFIRGLMTKVRVKDGSCKEKLEEWEILDFEAPILDDALDESQQRAAVLIGEITQLIDGNGGVKCPGWDGLITMLEVEQKAFGEGEADNHEGCDELGDLTFIMNDELHALDDWEYVAC